MDTQLYLRVRGRVLGPYDQEKLQSLVRRGQLSRMHEVSTDGTHWVRASTYAELFVGAPVKLVAPEMQSPRRRPPSSRRAMLSIPLADGARGRGAGGSRSRLSRRQPARGWYYEHQGAAAWTGRRVLLCDKCW